MILLVCGGRNYHDRETVFRVLDSLPFIPSMVIQGGALGADELAGQWAVARGIHFAKVPALWTVNGKSAGTKRNQAMLLIKPNYCVAFPGGTGTEDMVTRCESAGIPVWRPFSRPVGI